MTLARAERGSVRRVAAGRTARFLRLYYRQHMRPRNANACVRQHLLNPAFGSPTLPGGAS